MHTRIASNWLAIEIAQRFFAPTENCRTVGTAEKYNEPTANVTMGYRRAAGILRRLKPLTLDTVDLLQSKAWDWKKII